jgi:hypothetical protein
MGNEKFNFGHNEQASLFDTREPVEEPEHHSGVDGANPILPLQKFKPKELRLEPIEHFVARKIWLTEHYLHRDYAGATLEFGVFSPSMRELIGAIGFSSRLGGSVKGGKPDTWEIRRMWLSDERCDRNSESRVLRVSARLVKKLAPHVRYIISYSDHTLQGHKGTIYKAAGFTFSGETGNSDWTTNASHKTSDSHSKRRWILWLK